MENIANLNFDPLHTLVPQKADRDLEDVEKGLQPRQDIQNETDVYAILHGFDYYYYTGSGERLDELGAKAFDARRALHDWLHKDHCGEQGDPASINTARLGASEDYARILRNFKLGLDEDEWWTTHPLYESFAKHLEDFGARLKQVTAQVPESVVQRSLEDYERRRDEFTQKLIEVHTQEVNRIIDEQNRDRERKQVAEQNRPHKRSASLDRVRAPADSMSEGQPPRGRRSSYSGHTSNQPPSGRRSLSRG